MPKSGQRRQQILRINALAELERAGVPFEPASDSEVRLRCPVHEDENPSATLNVKKNVWQCWAAGCKAKGDIVTFLALHLSVERGTMLVDLSERYDLEDEKTINSETVERFHSKVFDSGPLLQALRDRGYKDEWIRADRIGYHDGRLTIPVKDRSGRVLDVLRYLPGAPGPKKMRHTRGYSRIRIYRPGDLKHDDVWILGGPIKAGAVGHTFEDAGMPIGAVSSTGGEGSWEPDWCKLLKGKRVWVCMDIDAHGVAAANKIASWVSPFAQQVRIIGLPLDAEVHPKGDVNDYIGAEGATAEDLHRCMTEAAEYEPPSITAFIEHGTRQCALAHVPEPRNIGWRLQVDCIAAAMDDTPYLVPRQVDVWCSRDQPQCHQCPIKREEPDERGFVEMEVHATSHAILGLTNAPTGAAQVVALKQGVGIPPRCKVVEFTVKNHFKVRDVRLAPQLTLSGEGSGNIMQPCMVVDEDLDLNVPYEVQGRVYPHPQSQRATVVADTVVETVDSLSTFEPDSTELDSLRLFQPREWTEDGIKEKLADLYGDLSANVTRIYDRPDLHLIYDLAYHSPLLFELQGRKVNGWVNVLVAGDSAQGKSETFVRLREHYGLGERVECKNATVAGLLGGLAQLGTRWFVSWGQIPAHDRRLVALEEVKGAPVEVIGKLTDMRSSGIAELEKIEKRRAHARTRLIFISNPRSNRTVASYSFGVEAFYELIGSPEDLRRFDLAMMVAAGQVDVDVMHEERTAPHRHTSELCRRLILWAWTRDRDEVVFHEDAVATIRQSSRELCEAYTEVLPLVDRGTIGHKLARLAAALAARMFSTPDDDLHAVLVRPSHVAIIAELLDRLYKDPHVGYDRFSRAQKSLDSVRDADKVRRYLTNTAHPMALVEGLLYRDDVTLVDIQDWTETDREVAQQHLSFLVRHHALRRKRRSSYGKTPKFIDLLREMSRQDFPDPQAVEEEM